MTQLTVSKMTADEIELARKTKTVYGCTLQNIKTGVRSDVEDFDKTTLENHITGKVGRGKQLTVVRWYEREPAPAFQNGDCVTIHNRTRLDHAFEGKEGTFLNYSQKGYARIHLDGDPETATVLVHPESVELSKFECINCPETFTINYETRDIILYKLCSWACADEHYA